jgi:transcription initiation factor IIE alpha subunit
MNMHKKLTRTILHKDIFLIIRDGKLSTSVISILIQLQKYIYYKNRHTDNTIKSIELENTKIANYTDISPRQIIRILNQLKELGIIDVDNTSYSSRRIIYNYFISKKSYIKCDSINDKLFKDIKNKIVKIY